MLPRRERSLVLIWVGPVRSPSTLSASPSWDDETEEQKKRISPTPGPHRWRPLRPPRGAALRGRLGRGAGETDVTMSDRALGPADNTQLPPARPSAAPEKPARTRRAGERTRTHRRGGSLEAPGRAGSATLNVMCKRLSRIRLRLYARLQQHWKAGDAPVGGKRLGSVRRQSKDENRGGSSADLCPTCASGLVTP